MPGDSGGTILFGSIAYSFRHSVLLPARRPDTSRSFPLLALHLVSEPLRPMPNCLLYVALKVREVPQVTRFFAVGLQRTLEIEVLVVQAMPWRGQRGLGLTSSICVGPSTSRVKE